MLDENPKTHVILRVRQNQIVGILPWYTKNGQQDVRGRPHAFPDLELYFNIVCFGRNREQCLAPMPFWRGPARQDPPTQQNAHIAATSPSSENPEQYHGGNTRSFSSFFSLYLDVSRPALPPPLSLSLSLRCISTHPRKSRIHRPRLPSRP